MLGGVDKEPFISHLSIIDTGTENRVSLGVKLFAHKPLFSSRKPNGIFQTANTVIVESKRSH